MTALFPDGDELGDQGCCGVGCLVLRARAGLDGSFYRVRHGAGPPHVLSLPAAILLALLGCGQIVSNLLYRDFHVVTETGLQVALLIVILILEYRHREVSRNSRPISRHGE